MPNPNNLSRTQKTTLIVLPIISFVLILASIITFFTNNRFTNSKNTPPKNPLLKNTSHSQAAQLTTTGNLPTTPKQLPYYQASTTTPVGSIAKTLSENLGLIGHPTQTNIWFNSEKTSSLSYSEDTQQISYSDSTLANAQTGVIEESKALSAASTFISNLPQNANLIVDKQKTSYFANTNEPTPVSADRAELIVFSYLQTIGDTPVYYDSNPDPTAQVWVGANYQIIKFTLTKQIVNPTPVGTSNIISDDDIQTLFDQNQVQIINIKNNQQHIFNTIKSVVLDLTTTKVEYRFSEETRLIYPFYNVASKITTDTGKTFDSQAIFPAVQTQKPPENSGFGQITR